MTPEIYLGQKGGMLDHHFPLYVYIIYKYYCLPYLDHSPLYKYTISWYSERRTATDPFSGKKYSEVLKLCRMGGIVSISVNI